MRRGESIKDRNKAIRQEALRESLVAGGHIQHVIEICNELNDLNIEMDATAVQRKRAVIDTKLKLINKYLPDLKSMELSNADDESFKTENKVIIEFVNAEDKD
jgi:Na+/phosphate symporter